MSQTTSKKRIANYELLRIISTLLILLYHFILYTNIWYNQFSINKVIGVSLASWSILGVDLYIVISAAFLTRESGTSLIDKLKRRYTKVFYIMAESLLLIILSEIIIQRSFSFRILFSSIFILIGHKFWYVRAYIMLLLLSPFLDILIRHVKLGYAVCMLILTLDFIPFFCNSTKLWKDVVQFMMIYMLTGLLLNSDIDKLQVSVWKCILLSGILITLTFYWICFFNSRLAKYPLTQATA